MKDAETGPRQTGPPPSDPDWPVDHRASCPRAFPDNMLYMQYLKPIYMLLQIPIIILISTYSYKQSLYSRLYILIQIRILMFQSTKELLPSCQPSQAWEHAPHAKTYTCTKHSNYLLLLLCWRIGGSEKPHFYFRDMDQWQTRSPAANPTSSESDNTTAAMAEVLKAS